ncbi:MAG TPA: NAD-dependent epimerase/dehydratase family protein [Candidatus Dormibacteraeota bacterium]|nr:NAD-dependent epimerase/dehydratase family protein [Candidatus Dormibacteraeota bacterium]
MKLLVLGGTRFLGRHLVEDALTRGHEVTLFNRSRTNPDLFAGVERVGGDRDGGLGGLRGRRWDAVADPSGYVPRVVRQASDLLRDATGAYAFISTGSVYPLHSEDKSEGGPLEPLADPASEDVNAHYGALKARCEAVVTEAFGDRALIVRSGLIVGPHDPTGRFTYWAVRLARGGEVLAPGEPGRRVQFIDARDQAAWILDMLEAGRGGTYNVTGPTTPLTFGELLARAAGAVTWVGDDFLVEQGVRPYSEMPLWVPPSAGGLHMPVERALAAGLRTRDVDATIGDTREWAETAAGALGGTLTPEREAELLERWHARA